MVGLLFGLTGCGHSSAVNVGTRVQVASSGRVCPAHVALAVSSRLRLGRGIGPVIAEGNSVWVANQSTGKLTHVARTSVTSLQLDPGPFSLALQPGRLWIAERDANRVISLDTQNLKRQTLSRLPVPVGVVADSSGVWALSIDTAAIYRINPSNGMTFAPADSPAANPTEMVNAGGELWVVGSGEQGISPFNGKLG